MKVELKALTIDQIKEILGQNNLRGIANAEEWDNARPLTLAGIIEEALNNHPDILWLVPTEERKVSRMEIDNQVNLCDSCRYVFPECPGEDSGVLYGNGTGNDNICSCKDYYPRYVEFLNGSTIYVTKASGNPEKQVQESKTGVISADAIRADVLKAPIENIPLHKSMQEAAEEFARGLKVGLNAVDVDSQEVEEEAECETEDCATAEPESADEDIKEAEPEKTEKSAESKLGKWEDYKGKALSTLEQNLIIKGMKEEGFSLAMISSVVRLSQPTVSNRIKKMRMNGEMEEHDAGDQS